MFTAIIAALKSDNTGNLRSQSSFERDLSLRCDIDPGKYINPSKESEAGGLPEGFGKIQRIGEGERASPIFSASGVRFKLSKLAQESLLPKQEKQSVGERFSSSFELSPEGEGVEEENISSRSLSSFELSSEGFSIQGGNISETMNDLLDKLEEKKERIDVLKKKLEKASLLIKEMELEKKEELRKQEISFEIALQVNRSTTDELQDFLRLERKEKATLIKENMVLLASLEEMQAELNILMGKITEIEEAMTCPISFELIKNPRTTPSGHCFQESSITGWIEKNGTCPFTSELLSVEQLARNFTLQKISAILQS